MDPLWRWEVRPHVNQWARHEKTLFLQRKIELLSPEKGRWMLGRQKQYISTMEANHDAVDGLTFFSNSWKAGKVYVVMFWRPREMPNITPGWRRIYDKNTPWQSRGCLLQTQQMKLSLIACSLGWTSNSLALGEEKLHRQPAFSPWHAEPWRKLFNLSQQWFPSYKNRMTIFTHSGLQAELEKEEDL